MSTYVASARPLQFVTTVLAGRGELPAPPGLDEVAAGTSRGGTRGGSKTCN